MSLSIIALEQETNIITLSQPYEDCEIWFTYNSELYTVQNLNASEEEIEMYSRINKSITEYAGMKFDDKVIFWLENHRQYWVAENGKCPFEWRGK